MPTKFQGRFSQPITASLILNQFTNNLNSIHYAQYYFSTLDREIKQRRLD